jgi:hypothetical protein
MIQKPLTQTLADRHSMELDPEQVARSFGVVYPVNAPLPETAVPVLHAEEDDTIIQLDTRAPRPAPADPILAIAMRRLKSLKPRSPERRAEVEAIIAALAVPLEGLDLMILEIETEHFEAIDARWEQIRKDGRNLADSMPTLQGALYTAMQQCNASGEAKGQRKQDLETFYWQRKRISQWSTSEEIAAADLQFENARSAMQRATDAALEDQRSMAAAESKLATAQANLQNLKTELHRLATELRGDPYFDPALGLSRDPLSHREKW